MSGSPPPRKQPLSNTSPSNLDQVSPSTASVFLNMNAQAEKNVADPSEKPQHERPTHITLPSIERQPSHTSATSLSYPPTSQPNESQAGLTTSSSSVSFREEDLPDQVYIPADEQFGLPRRGQSNAFRKQAKAMIAARRMAGNKPTAVVDAVSSGESSDEEQELNERRRAVAAAEALAQARAHEQRIELRGTEAYGAASNSEAQRKPKKPIKSYFSEGIDKARMKFTDGGSSPSALGALSAAAMDLGGVAAPEGTSLRPDYERKGYYLNRWSVDNSPDRSPVTSPKARHASPSSQDLSEVVEKLEKHKRNASDTSIWELSDSISKWTGMATPGGMRSGKSSPRAEKAAKRRKQELWITRHLASVLERHEFILLLTRACMLFGAPTHALEQHIEDTARVLDVSCQAVLIMSFMVISFKADEVSQTSVKIVKQSTALDMAKLRALSYIHGRVIHDEVSVSEAMDEISELMLQKPLYGFWTQCALGAACSVCISQAAFNASFVDLLVIAPLGAFVILAQSTTARYFKRFNSVLEVLLCGIVSFAASGLSSTGYFCYASTLSGSIVLLLPGWLVCQSALELQNRSITSGSVRLVWTLIYSLFIGFGISLGSTIWIYSFPNLEVRSPSDTLCTAAHHDNGHGDIWYLKTISPYFMFLFVPMYPVWLALKNGAKFTTKEFAGSTIVGVAGFVVNHFSARHFPQRADLTSVFGAATVGLLSNAWTKAFNGPSFLVALPGIMFQLPSGLSNGGLLSFATTQAAEDVTVAFGNLFSVVEQLLIVALGLVVGLFTSTAVFALFWSIFWKKRHMTAKDLISF